MIAELIIVVLSILPLMCSAAAGCCCAASRTKRGIHNTYTMLRMLNSAGDSCKALLFCIVKHDILPSATKVLVSPHSCKAILLCTVFTTCFYVCSVYTSFMQCATFLIDLTACFIC
jgi:hypothetical protein